MFVSFVADINALLASELDVLMLGTVFPPYCSVTSKKQLKWVPFLGWFMTLSKTVFIDRGNRETARQAFDGAARQMKSERQSVYIFPEGTRSYTSKPEMLPFKKGAFHLAIQAQVPIVPIVVANYSEVLSFRKRIFTSGTIAVQVLPPVLTTGLKSVDVEHLSASVRDRMISELRKLTQDEQARGISTVRSSASTTGTDGSNKPDLPSPNGYGPRSRT
ncbi:MAG: 1-acylglycerol-3-phosphate O-acyltransferase [Chrysothrix sp. TS-e1954]|nr:MAG: 1-acylglycerol-3-phosphate O-acyltransferase [Chrysothrix sp. TS-e1954]